MIILFGSNGYIGSEFKKQLTELKLPVFYWPNAHKTTFQDLEKWYDEAGFPLIGAVINAAGYTGKPNVDACELNKEDTLHGNVIWPQILTDWCALNDIPIGHVSSGCIYQGRREDGNPFTEKDEPNFTWTKNNGSFYSGTKAIGETVVSKWEKSYIWRLRIPFEENNNPRNYLTKMIKYEKLLQAENSISNKQEFVSACIQTITKKVPYGIYNVTNTGYLTTDKLVEKLKNTIAKDRQFKLIDEKELYSGIATAKRSNCVMDNSKLLSTGITMRTVDEAIDYCLNNWTI
jgi:UDP-glucose 4,6-dehydratase